MDEIIRRAAGHPSASLNKLESRPMNPSAKKMNMNLFLILFIRLKSRALRPAFPSNGRNRNNAPIEAQLEPFLREDIHDQELAITIAAASLLLHSAAVAEQAPLRIGLVYCSSGRLRLAGAQVDAASICS